MKLDLSNRGLTSLQEIDLTNVTELNCDCNRITALNNLPTGLKKLSCSFNQLTDQGLNNLPTGLQFLYCSNNQLTSLNNLPTGLKILYCYYNQITDQGLNNLPTGLQILDCENNQLSVISNLPIGLQILYCGDNQLDETDINIIKLQQHNQRLAKMGLKTVEQLPSIDVLNQVLRDYTLWRYQPGGDIYKKCEKQIENGL